jgi:hypothetical protein
VVHEERDELKRAVRPHRRRPKGSRWSKRA